VKAIKVIAATDPCGRNPCGVCLPRTTGLVIGQLQGHLYESERNLPASIFHEQIGRGNSNIFALMAKTSLKRQALLLCKAKAKSDSCRSIRGTSTEATVHSSALSTAAIGHVADVEPGAPQGPDW
jgi:hypothetical protein